MFLKNVFNIDGATQVFVKITSN